MNTKKRIKVNNLQKVMESRLLSSGAGFVGFADVSNHRIPDSEEMCSAISIGIPYNSSIIERLDTEIDAFRNHQRGTNERMEHLLEICEQYLQKQNFATRIHFSGNLPGLLSDFSHKVVATKAGLGWMVKVHFLSLRNLDVVSV